jgi:thioesterase domain-containing protein
MVLITIIYNSIAKYYLSEIQKIADFQSLDEQIVLMGWSFGGFVALEIASILEKLGYVNIQIYLADPMLSDKKLCEMSGLLDPQANRDALYAEKILKYRTFRTMTSVP